MTLTFLSHPPLTDSLFLRACRRESTDRTPIWLMRQAGRYMKEYRDIRAKMPFLELCKNAEVCAQITVDAAHRLDVDAAIIFSDLLMIVEPLGFQLSYGVDQGPMIGNPFRSENDAKRLQPVNVSESLRFVFDAIRYTRRDLKPSLPLIGFAGAPFTMASYLIEGRSSRHFLQTKKIMYANAGWTPLMEALTTATADYLNAQIEAGVQAVQIFDSWVGCLSPADYATYVAPYTRRLIAGIKSGVPVILFGTQTGSLLPLMKESGAAVIGFDSHVELGKTWDALGPVAVQGNLDPTVLFSDKDNVVRQAQRILQEANGRPGHIFNLGHGILPETPVDHVLRLIDTVKNHRVHQK